MRLLCPTSLLVFLALVSGCSLPAQLVWSPDGRRAAYWSNDQQRAYVISDTGAILADLGPSFGGFAWTSDSKTLYFASASQATGRDKSAEEHGRWLPKSPFPRLKRAVPGLTANSHDTKEPYEISVSSWSDTQPVKPLFRTRRFAIVYMDLSPDQEWLAMLTLAKHKFPGRDDAQPIPALHVYSLRKQRLYILEGCCPPAFCFTSPNRIAYVQWDWSKLKAKLQSKPPQSLEDDFPPPGHLVEVQLDHRKWNLDRTRLAPVSFAWTCWLSAVGHDIIFTALPEGRPSSEDSIDYLALKRFSRRDQRVRQLEARVGLILTRSPDGNRIIFHRLPADAAADNKGELCLLNVHDEQVVVLDHSDRAGSLPTIFPSWRGNDQITFIPLGPAAPEPTRKDNACFYDLVLYRLTDNRLEPLHTLTTPWPTAMKPCFRELPRRITTTPTTLPAKPPPPPPNP